jgi:hypothetical protein
MKDKPVVNEKALIEYNHRILQKEINCGRKDPLNREIFKKTPEERIKIWEMKSAWKRDMIKCFPDPKIRRSQHNPICL